jgi:MFS family permease
LVSRQGSVPAPAAAKGVTTVRTACPLAWLLPGLYAALTVSGLVLQRLAGLPEDPAMGLAGGVALSAAIGVWSLAAGLLAAHRPANPIGWIMGATALVWALQQFGFGYAAYGLLADPGSLPAAISMALLYVTMVLLFELGIALLFLLFPDGRLPSRRWRPVLWAGLVAGAVLVPGGITDPRPIGNLGVRSPVQVGAAPRSILTPLFLVAFLVLFAVLLASVVSLWLRLRRARGEARQQLKWFAYATAVVPVGFGLLFFGFDPDLPTDQIAMALLVVAAVAMPVAVAVAIFKYRLYDIDRIINRTIVYGLLSAILGLGYTGAVLLLGQALGRSRSNLAVAGATLATALVFQPARRQVQQVVDRRFNRRRYDAAKTIQAFSVRLRQQIDLHTLTAELLAVVTQTMEPTSVSLWLRPPQGPHLHPGTRE